MANVYCRDESELITYNETLTTATSLGQEEYQYYIPVPQRLVDWYCFTYFHEDLQNLDIFQWDTTLIVEIPSLFNHPFTIINGYSSTQKLEDFNYGISIIMNNNDEMCGISMYTDDPDFYWSEHWDNIIGEPAVTIKVGDPFRQLTYKDIGAASATHTHSWTDFNGIIPLSKGGTGRSTFPTNSVVYKGTSQLEGLTASEGVLLKDISSGTLTWAPSLPITAGGTGCTSRDQVTSDIICCHKVAAINNSFSISLGAVALTGRMWNDKTGFRVLVPLPVSFSGYNTPTFSGIISVRTANPNGNYYLFGSSGSGGVAISNITGQSNVFTTINIGNKPYIGCVEISAGVGTAQTGALGMVPISVYFSNLTFYFTAAT